jgi:hypothetical protein
MTTAASPITTESTGIHNPVNRWPQPTTQGIAVSSNSFASQHMYVYPGFYNNSTTY